MIRCSSLVERLQKDKSALRLVMHRYVFEVVATDSRELVRLMERRLLNIDLRLVLIPFCGCLTPFVQGVADKMVFLCQSQ